ncbi:hypothetical protein CTH_2259 [Carboxydocella thermautotrophica]|nr:hypothetical protein CTH_2259 [Carboxydocella thermautotrophica]
MRYIALTGLEYNGKRVEPGDVIDDLPKKSIKWLLEQGLIRPITAVEPEKGGDT